MGTLRLTLQGTYAWPPFTTGLFTRCPVPIHLGGKRDQEV